MAMRRNWGFSPGALGDTEGPQQKTGQIGYVSRMVPRAARWGTHQKGACWGLETASAGGEMLARRKVLATRAKRDGCKRSFVRPRQVIGCDNARCAVLGLGGLVEAFPDTGNPGEGAGLVQGRCQVEFSVTLRLGSACPLDSVFWTSPEMPEPFLPCSSRYLSSIYYVLDIVLDIHSVRCHSGSHTWPQIPHSGLPTNQTREQCFGNSHQTEIVVYQLGRQMAIGGKCPRGRDMITLIDGCFRGTHSDGSDTGRSWRKRY